MIEVPVIVAMGLRIVQGDLVVEPPVEVVRFSSFALCYEGVLADVFIHRSSATFLQSKNETELDNH